MLQHLHCSLCSGVGHRASELPVQFSAMFWKDGHRRTSYINVLAVEGALCESMHALC